MHKSEKHFSDRQDHRVEHPNIRLFGMGPPGRFWDRIPRMRRIRAACQAARPGATGLLIRGITPRQYSVWQWVGLAQTAYLLVGTLGDAPASASGASLPSRLYAAWMRRHRIHELARIAPHAVLLANSPGLVTELKQKYRCPAQFVPTSTISQREFPPATARPISHPVRLLFCGRVVEDKGIREAIEAVGMIRKSGTGCVLDVVGPISPDVRQQLEGLSLQCGAQGSVRFHGPVAYGDALFEFYRCADFFVLPTYHEGFPHVLWEAAAHSCAVVTCGIGGIPALLEHETHALLLAPRNARAVSEAILRLLGDDALRQKLVHAAYRRATEFTVETCAEKLSNILAERWS
jgi:glycosyltransferase involved in cell wall biosynthesis